MKITLSPEYRELVALKIASGQYRSENEVIEDAVRQLHEQDIINSVGVDTVREMLTVAEAEFENGKFRAYASVQELAAEIKAKGRKRTVKRSQ